MGEISNKKNIILIAICIIFSSGLLNVPQVKGLANVVIEVRADADTYVLSYLPDQDERGDRDFFALGSYYSNDIYNGTKYHPYLRFVIPHIAELQGKQILSLTLRLFADYTSGADLENWAINVSLVDNNWNELGLNWTHNRPAYLGKSIHRNITNTDLSNEYKYLDLTTFKNDMVNNTFSLWMQSVNQSHLHLFMRFNSKEDDMNKEPVLYVEYDENVPEAIPITPPEPEPINGFRFTQDSYIATADTWISSWLKTTNFGTQSKLDCGILVNGNDIREGYFRFNTAERPENWTKAEIKLYSEKYPHREIFYLDIYLVEDDWNETTLIWNNRPNKSEFIERLDFYYQEEGEDDLFFLIDVSEYVNDSDTSISICINASIIRTEDNYAHIYSREHNSYSLRPRLVWSYYAPDIYPPSIQILPPQEYEVFGEDSPTFTINRLIDDSSILSRWYSIDNGVTNHTFTGLTQKINQEDWDNHADGEVIIQVYAEDFKGNIGCGTRKVWKNTHGSEPDPDPNFAIPSYDILITIGAMALLGVISVVSKLKKIRVGTRI